MVRPVPTPFAVSLPAGQAGGTIPPREPGAGAASPRLATHPLQATLRTQVVAAGERMIQRFVESMDSGVQGLLAESRNAAETRALLDLGHALSISRPTLARGFLAALHRRFDPLDKMVSPSVLDRQSLTLKSAEEMEEAMVLANLAELADEKAGESGRQVRSRLEWAAREQALPALQDALTAAALPQCYAQAFRQAGFAQPERLLAYRLVQTQGLNDWPRLMAEVLAALDQQGFSMPRLLSAPAAQDALPPVSDATLNTLRLVASRDPLTPDGRLALALCRSIEPPMARSDAARITVLAGAWLDGLLADVELPPSFAPDLESLRLAVIKAALCDPTFLTQSRHSVRSAVDELARRAAFTGLQDYSLIPLRAELRDLADYISIHGQFALDALAMLPPLDADLPQQCQRLAEKDRQLRHERLLQSVSTLATREIDARTLDVSLPAAARAALSRGFLPLLSTLMLRHGTTAPQTRQARQLLERFVDSFALSVGGDERESVLSAMQTLLQHTGLSGPHITGVCQALKGCYAELEQEARGQAAAEPATTAAPVAEPSRGWRRPPPPVASPLQVLLQPGQWFRVRDYKRGDDRWLSLSGIHLDQDRLAFSGFDGATALALRLGQFVEDLVSGLAEPLNPSPAVQQALERLRASPGGLHERLLGFG